MAILVDENTRVVVQGITGTFGALTTESMLRSGTKVVAGVTPGKGGQKVHGVPVYDSVEEALAEHPEANAAINFVPAALAKDSLFEAIKSKLSLIVVPVEGIPVHDAIEVINYAKLNNVRIIGPESIGVFSPNKCKLGVHPDLFFRSGNVGIVARGGTIVYEVSSLLMAKGFGVSTCVNLGDHMVIGVSFADVLRMFEEDDETKAIVLIGEIGGTFEEGAAPIIKDEVTKPVIALINGRAAPPGKKMGHASAIVQMGMGSYQSKAEALSRAGAHVVKNIMEIPDAVSKHMH
jgi:succinyl-CoA synthetase alpha subunit